MVKLINFSKKIEISVTNQFLSVICANIISLSHGCVIAWASPILPYLKSEETHFEAGPITLEEASWIGSIICVGGLIGNFGFGYLSEKIGRKKSILLLAFPHIGFWLFVIFAQNVYHLYIARVLAGICGGGIFVTITIYTSEVAQDRIRGTLGAILILSMNTGVLLGFILGKYFIYFTLPLIVLCFPVMFLIGFFFVPETPIWLMKHKKIKEAEKSLKFYRGINCKESLYPTEFKEEFEKLKHFSDVKTVLETNADKLHYKDFVTPAAKKGLLIGIVLMTLNQFSGCFAFVNYSATIFEVAKSGLHPNDSTIIIGFIQLVGTYVSLYLVDKSGRKILMIVSSFGSCMGATALGIYSYLQTVGYDVSHIGWVAIASLSFAIFLASIGIICLNFVIVGEVLPQKIRGIGTTICLCILSLEAFLVLKMFPILMDIINLYGCMWLFAIVCFAGGLFVIFVVPETKGKNLNTVDVVNVEKNCDKSSINS